MKYVNYKHVCIPICHAELPTCTSPLACSACPSSHWQRNIDAAGFYIIYTAFCNLVIVQILHFAIVHFGNPLRIGLELCARFPPLHQCQPQCQCLHRKMVPLFGAKTCSQMRKANGWVFWFRKNMLRSFLQRKASAKLMKSEQGRSSF